jgi:hypothetical protein
MFEVLTRNISDDSIATGDDDIWEFLDRIETWASDPIRLGLS